MKTAAGQALHFAASAWPPMRQARYAGTALNHDAAAREGHRPPACHLVRYRQHTASTARAAIVRSAGPASLHPPACRF